MFSSGLPPCWADVGAGEAEDVVGTGAVVGSVCAGVVGVVEEPPLGPSPATLPVFPAPLPPGPATDVPLLPVLPVKPSPAPSGATEEG